MIVGLRHQQIKSEDKKEIGSLLLTALATCSHRGRSAPEFLTIKWDRWVTWKMNRGISRGWTGGLLGLRQASPPMQLFAQHMQSHYNKCTVQAEGIGGEVPRPSRDDRQPQRVPASTPSNRVIAQKVLLLQGEFRRLSPRRFLAVKRRQVRALPRVISRSKLDHA